MGKVGHVEDICISDDYQGQGLGRTMIKALDSIAMKKGCRKSILDCSMDNTEFYMKCGYKTSSIHMSKAWEEDEDSD